ETSEVDGVVSGLPTPTRLCRRTSLSCISALARRPALLICQFDIAGSSVETQRFEAPVSGRTPSLVYDTRSHLGFGVHDITRGVVQAERFHQRCRFEHPVSCRTAGAGGGLRLGRRRGKATEEDPERRECSFGEIWCMTILRAGVVPMAPTRGSNCQRFFR